MKLIDSWWQLVFTGTGTNTDTNPNVIYIYIFIIICNGFCKLWSFTPLQCYSLFWEDSWMKLSLFRVLTRQNVETPCIYNPSSNTVYIIIVVTHTHKKNRFTLFLLHTLFTISISAKSCPLQRHSSALISTHEWLMGCFRFFYGNGSNEPVRSPALLCYCSRHGRTCQTTALRPNWKTRLW